MEPRSNKTLVINPRAVVTGLGVTSILLWITSFLIGNIPMVGEYFWGRDPFAAERWALLALTLSLFSFTVFACIVVHKKYWSTANVACIVIGLAMMTYVLSGI